MSFVWEERVSPFQRGVLKASVVVGVLTFFAGVQLTVRGRPELGGALSGFGMFLAASMKWGVKSLFNTIEEKSPSLLERFGYGGLFWILFGLAFVIDSLGVVALIFYAADYL